MSYLVRRLIASVVALWVLSVLVFVLAQSIPGGPVEQLWYRWSFHSDSGAGAPIPEAARQMLVEHFGFNRPLWVRYLTWIAQIARGDLGFSFYHSESVESLIVRALGPSIWLGALAFGCTYLLTLGLGITQVYYRNRYLDRAVSSLSFLFFALPTFALAVFLSLALGAGWLTDYFPLFGWQSLNLPVGFWAQWRDRVWHAVLPVACYTATALPPLLTLFRDSLQTELRSVHTTTARAKGASEFRVIWKHALPGAALPLIYSTNAWFTFFISGSVVVETIFALPGMGRLGYQAAIQRDFPVLLALVLALGAVQILGNLIADLLHLRLDRRVKLG